MSFPRQFIGPTVFSLICLGLAGAYGWHFGGNAAAVLADLWIVLVLAVLEISLSLDNAVVNARVLAEMDTVWRRRFLTWGMAIAVFGTRIALPLAIVGVTARLGPAEALRLSLTKPDLYAQIVGGAHIFIAGFGGSFLSMVGLGFFLDPAKDLHWLVWIEAHMFRLGRVRASGAALVLAVLIGIAHFLPGAEATRFLIAGGLGLVAFVAMEGLGVLLEPHQGAGTAAGVVVRSGIGAFLYLNLLDASFSLDGVIGAFALSTNMVVIALGLSIGAIFVRTLTLMLVDQGTLGRYRYLEHGAFWAIIALGVIMLASALVTMPEVVTGGIGAVLIGAAIWTSRRAGTVGVS